MDWWEHFLANCNCDVFLLHLKTQTNDPSETFSLEMFSDWPLQWQYLNLRAIEPYLAKIPEKFANLPIYVPELNPQHKNDGLGWESDNFVWVVNALAYLRHKVDGVCFYRYDLAGDQAGFGLRDKPRLLKTIKD